MDELIATPSPVLMGWNRSETTKTTGEVAGTKGSLLLSAHASPGHKGAQKSHRFSL